MTFQDFAYILGYYSSLMPLIGGLKLYVIVQSIMGDTLPFGRDWIILNNPRQLVMANKVYGEESIISVPIASGNGVVSGKRGGN